MHKLYAARELAVLHAVASPYRERSHFDGQNLLENGTAKPFGRETGWLNAALAAGGRARPAAPAALRARAEHPARAARSGAGRLLVALAHAGARCRRCSSGWRELYRGDALLGAVLRDGARGADDDGEAATAAWAAARSPSWRSPRRRARSSRKRDGPRVASIDFGGWDTHIGQLGEYGPLTRNLRLLDRSVATLKASLGPAWRHTAVLMVTRVRPHRGAERLERHRPRHRRRGVRRRRRGARRARDRRLAGARRRALHEGRDLRPTLDLRALFKAALVAQLGLDEAALETKVFPESAGVRPLEGLFA